MKSIKNLSLLAFALVSTLSCNNDDNTPPATNEEELITTVRVALTNGANTVNLVYKDLDGDGSGVPQVTVSGTLSPSTTYAGTVSFLNESVDPADNITSEVEAEGVDHQVFHQAPASIGAFTYDDLDTAGKPIGLKFNLTTGASANTGNLVVTLRHMPNKSASGVSSGNITNAGGATDVQVTYPIQVQ